MLLYFFFLSLSSPCRSRTQESRRQQRRPSPPSTSTVSTIPIIDFASVFTVSAFIIDLESVIIDFDSVIVDFDLTPSSSFLIRPCRHRSNLNSQLLQFPKFHASALRYFQISVMDQSQPPIQAQPPNVDARRWGTGPRPPLDINIITWNCRGLGIDKTLGR